MSASGTTTSVSGRRLLVDWANGQDHWTRGIVAEVLSTRKPLSESSLRHFYQQLLQEKELAPGKPPFFDKLEDAADGTATEDSLTLTKLAQVENVNALAPKQEIEFNPTLTLIFGENGAGKTGYVRVLKTVAAVRNAEPILSNVHKPGGGPPSADLSFQVGGVPDTLHWHGEQGVRPLTRLDILDSRGLLLHVDEELTYVYTPGDLALFRIVHQAAEGVRQLLDAERAKRLPPNNPFLSRFSRESALYAKIEALGPATNPAELTRLAQITASEEEQLPALRDGVEALRGRGSGDRLQLVRDELAVFRQVHVVVEAVRTFSDSSYASALQTREVALAQHRQVSRENFRDVQLPGLLSEAWKGLIDAAERYIHETEHDQYPADKDACAYCRQPLSEAARQLIQKYRAYSNSQDQRDADRALHTARQAAGPIVALDVAQLVAELTRRQQSFAPAAAPEVFAAALRFLQEAIALKSQLAQDAPPTALTALTSADAALRDLLTRHLQTATALEATLTTELRGREQKLAEELPKLRLLEARITLRDLLPDILKHVEESQWADKARRVLTTFQGKFKSLTDASKAASELLLNQDFDTRFRRECEALKAPQVTVDFPGRKGEPARRKSIAANHRLSTILSEGEQKVIALADFLAESSLRRASSPVVLDDPVTSLDYKRLSYVVGRIVDLSRDRQVIVFTHNIWFTMELLARFEDEKDRCTYYDVSQDGKSSGIVARASSPRLDTWGDKSGRINGLIARIKTEKDKSIKDALIEKAYEDLRGTCEIVVEQNVLQRVVQSYTPNVMVAKLRDINVTALPAAITTVNDIFDRCCRFIASHKQSLESLNVRPSLEDLEQDWTALKEVRKSCGT